MSTVKRKCTGLKDAPERRLEAVLKSSGIWTPLGEMGFGFLPQPRVTLRVEGRPVDLVMNLGTQNSVLLRADGPRTDKRTWVQCATGVKPYSLPREQWTWEQANSW